MAGENYNGNRNLKATGQKIEWTREQLQEFIKCMNDPVYFCKYIKIISVDDGIIDFEPYEFQKDIIKGYQNSRLNVIVAARQLGKCVEGGVSVLTRTVNSNTIYERNTTLRELFETTAPNHETENHQNPKSN